MNLRADVLPVLLCFAAPLPAADYAIRLGEQSFLFTLPDHWKPAGNVGPMKAFICQDDRGDRVSLTIAPQPNDRGMDHIKAAYERDFPKVMKDFQLRKSEIREIGKRRTLLMDHTNTTPGAKVRQFFFVPDLGKLTVSLTFTERDEANDQLHAEYEAVVASLRPGKQAP